MSRDSEMQERTKGKIPMLDAYRILREAQGMEPAPVSEADISSLEEQVYAKVKILSYLYGGHTLKEAAGMCGLHEYKARLMMKYDEGFRDAVNLEREMRLSSKAEELERAVWDRALDGGRRDSMLLSMYALKARHGEYRDNHVPTNDTQVKIEIKVDGQKFDATFVPGDGDSNG